ncbi:MAG TPA: alpha-amylase family glycosyl hydrolase [Abditibacteriaceae bacterium]|jgi:glycosidase
MRRLSISFRSLAQRYVLLSLVGAGLTIGEGISCAQAPNTVPAGKIPEQSVQQSFIYEAAPDIKTVSVAGTFNNWDRNANPLSRDGSGNTWRTTLKLPFGKHTYKFVLNGETWITDPRSTRNESDGNGNTNSVLFLTPPDYLRPASSTDGITARSALQHLTAVPHLNYDRGRLTLSLRTRPRDLQRVRLKVGTRRYPMSLVTTDDLYARYSTQLAWNRKQDLSYEFELLDGAKVQEYGDNGLGAPEKVRPFRLKAAEFQPFVVPNWVERTVFYQIFPDRFANGSKANDPADVQPWDVKPTWYNRLGGDAQGVRQHVPHLVDLGVSAVYFNPIFKAPSNHRYDAEDFRRIDPQFGTNAEFAALARELKSKNIRTVLDFVFNHTATTFAPFLDIRQKGEASAYKDWYFIKSYPVRVQENPNYVAWFNYPSMPKLNLAHPQTRDYMLDLVDYWHRALPLAGLRLDVANEVSSEFWRDLRKRAKSIDPQMWIVGEVWGDGSPWLTGDQWDSVMNYQFLFANRDFFAEGKTTTSEYSKRLMQLHNSYVPQVSRNMMNLLSSHDTPRFLTLCNNNQDLHRLAATVQFTWVGAPSVYYGEELGMQGGADPDNRRGMEWNLATPANPMLRYYKKLIRLRNASRALQSGDPAILLADDHAQTLAYSRTLGNEIAIVAFNRSTKPQMLEVPLPRSAAMQSARESGLVDGISNRRVPVGTAQTVRLTLAPLRAAVLLPATRVFLSAARDR